MTYQAKQLKAAARNTDLPQKDAYGDATYYVRTEIFRVKTPEGGTASEYGNATLYVKDYYDYDLILKIAKQLTAAMNCLIYINMNSRGQATLTATNASKSTIALVDPFNREHKMGGAITYL